MAALGYSTGGVNETVARFPSALAAVSLILGVAMLAARHYGPHIGLLAGSVQATTAWTVMRGRLAEADILLACLVTWTIVAFDRVLPNAAVQSGGSSGDAAKGWRLWRWAFLVLLGVTALVKGIGFGAVLILLVVAGVLLWQRDLVSLRRLYLPAGWALAIFIALSWPLFMVAKHGYGALSLWTMHVSDRLIRHQGPGPFAGEPWWEYVPGLLTQAPPVDAAGPDRRMAITRSGFKVQRRHEASGEYRNTGHGSGWRPSALCLGVSPSGFTGAAPIKNAHYAISVQVPWSIWAALTLASLGQSPSAWGLSL